MTTPPPGKPPDDSRLRALAEQHYARLRKLASAKRVLYPNARLGSVSLLHHTYLRARKHPPNTEEELFIYFSRLMVEVLLDAARRWQAQKNRAIFVTSFDPQAKIVSPEQVLMLQAALDELEVTDPRLRLLVQYKYFLDLTDQETADLLGMSERHVRRKWEAARAFLRTRVEPYKG